jgi:hypothetical protein
VVFSLKGISARISEFSLRGMLRIVFKPLISDLPLIGGVQVGRFNIFMYLIFTEL